MRTVKTGLRAKDVMTTEPVCVEPSTTIRELAHVFEEHEISGVPVVDQRGVVVGVVSKTDLIRRCSEGRDDTPSTYLFEILSGQGSEDGRGTTDVIAEPLICVQDIMTEDPLMVSPDVAVGTVARLMAEKRIHRVIVADDERFPVGIITTLDLLGLIPR